MEYEFEDAEDFEANSANWAVPPTGIKRFGKRVIRSTIITNFSGRDDTLEVEIEDDRKGTIDRECSCGAWMEQTGGYIENGVSFGTSWKCPNCGKMED